MFNDLGIIILSGGFGTRIRNTIGNDVPKILAPINKKPFLDYFLDWLKPLTNNKGATLTFSFHHNYHPIIKYIKDKKVRCSYVIDEKAYGTFGALCNSALKFKKKEYLVLNGDTIFKADLRLLYDKFLIEKNLPFLVLKEQSTDNRYGGYVLKNAKFIYSKYNSKLISLGAYFITHQELIRRWEKSTDLPFSNNSFRNFEGFPLMNDENCLGLEPINGICLKKNVAFIDIGLKDTFLKAQSEIPQIMKSYN